MEPRAIDRRILRGSPFLLAPLALGATACKSPEEWKEHADREVYALVDSRRDELFATPGGFTIEPPATSLRRRILAGELDAVELSLERCLDVAAENSRDYQSRKEQLYLAALDLTAERRRFEARPFSSLSAAVAGTGSDAEVASVDGDLGLTKLMGNGATIVTSIGASLFRALSTGDGWDAVSALSFSFTQPLLRGSGRLVVQEPLTQAERNLVYQVRDYERFRRSFAFDVASRYYSLLEAVDQLENQRRNLENLLALRQRNEALAAAGRISDIQVDQARQDELRSENQVLRQEAGLQRELDDFKIFLGLPVDVAIELDHDDFAELTEEDPLLDSLGEEQAARIALAERLDLLNTAGELEDSVRRVAISEDDLRAALDLGIGANVGSPEGRPASFSTGDSIWSVALGLELPVDKLDERNAYRESLIALARAERDLEEAADQIRGDLRDSLRSAATTRESYQIQRGAVALAERRVQSAELSLLAGRASTRDLLEAQESLLEARNEQTSALIDFTLARLGLYLDLEMLRVDEQGISVDESLVAASEEEQP